MTFTGDGRSLILASWEQRLKIDLDQGKVGSIEKWQGPRAFAPDGRVVQFTSVAPGSAEHRQLVQSNSDSIFMPAEINGLNWPGWELTTVAVSQDGRSLAVAFNHEQDSPHLRYGRWLVVIKIWDTMTGRVRVSLHGHTQRVRHLAFAADGKSLFSVSCRDATTSNLYGGVRRDWCEFKWWDLTTGRELPFRPGHFDPIRYLVVSPDGKNLAVGVGEWKPTEVKVIPIPVRVPQDRVALPAFIPDGKLLIAESVGRSIQLSDGTTGQALHRLEGHSEAINALAISKDGKLCASASGPVPGELKLWDLAAGKLRTELAGHSDVVSAVAFSPDGKVLASAGWDGTVRLWDVGTGKETQVMQGHTTAVRCLVFSPDGKFLASASRSVWSYCRKGELKLWDASTGKLYRTLMGKVNAADESLRPEDQNCHPADALSFSPDGKFLAVGGEDGWLQLWDLTEPENEKALSHRDLQSEGITALTFSGDGKSIVVGCANGKIHQLASQTLKMITSVQAGKAEVAGLVVRGDGRVLIGTGRDGAVQSWRFTKEGKLRASTSREK